MTVAVRETPDSLTGLPDAYRRWRASRLGRVTDALEEDLILKLVGASQGRRILDVGCGDGALATALARRGAILTGVDTDPRMLAAGRERARAETVEITLVEGNAGALPFPDETFDVVLAVTVLCFAGDAERAVGEMARVLKPGGRLVIGELGRWNLWAAKRRISGCLGSPTWRAAKFRTARELAKLIAGAGLTVIARRGAIFYPPCAACATLLAPIDPWLGRCVTFGAAFIGMAATKPQQ